MKPGVDDEVPGTGLPVFTAGSATLDAEGHPVVNGETAPPPASAGTVQPEIKDGAQPPATQQQKPSEPPAQQVSGTAGAAPPSQPDPSSPAAQPSGSAAGAAAAEAAVQELVDVEIEDFDLGDTNGPLKYVAKVPKQFEQIAKRAFPRRADYDRSRQYLRKAEPIISQMVEDGRMNRILPLIELAFQDQEFGDYVYEGYVRRAQGLPAHLQAAAIEAAQAGAAAAAAPAYQPQYQQPLQQQPPQAGAAALTEEQLFYDVAQRQAMEPYLRRQAELEGRLNQYEQQRQLEAQRFQEQQQQQVWTNEQMRAAHIDITAQYPDAYTGDFNQDKGLLHRVADYAQRAGYVDAYGIRGAWVLAAQQIRQIDQERAYATASPTARALAEAEAQHARLAPQQIADAARSVGAAGGAAPAAPVVAQRPSTRDANGNLKQPAQYLAEVRQALAAGAR